MKLKELMLGSLLASVFAFTACDKDDEVDSRLSQQDRTFMTQAAHGNLAEVELGQLAQQKGQSDSVQMFGQMMVMDHSGAKNELDSLSNTVNYDLPNTLDPEHQAMRQRLNALTGVSFDTAYINGQVLDHQRNIALFETQAASGQYQPLRDYANKYLPGLRLHLALADSIANTLQ